MCRAVEVMPVFKKRLVRLRDMKCVVSPGVSANLSKANRLRGE